jgi:hypothetical protein
MTAEHLICHPFTPCGGDLIGRWRIVSGCWDPEFLKGPCPSLAYHSLEQEATYEFFSSGVYQFGPSSFTLTYTATFDASCSFAAVCEPSPSSDEERIVGTECFREGDGCRCETTSSGRGPVETHAYSVSGNEVTMIVDETTGAYSPWQYCVQGDEATFRYEGIGGFSIVRE